MKSIKKVFVGLSVFFMGVISKIYGLSLSQTQQADLYGPPQLIQVNSIWSNVLKILLIPIAVIGIVVIGVVLLASSSSKKKNSKNDDDREDKK